ncbi:DNA-directed RNA polymerase I subunit rpa43 isoform X1 [Arachis duranensis]|uniref:DNA-directed RNA polymerase subunit n=1 Tax=Arachis duranensis TaxID=130453 RepID=A0A6P4E4Y5_ARADU|nr:DNA-directed RNA polymerase I subunit rpa43 isoform X1 [Arachis duranensis]XP_052107764.1 DNA-directed RNA polymerase I subunit rpa43 isoform X1 [Arachis duranensis]XP_052107765.1 DNA-directed RNA polymerase I subunit rpa43 isoform X1 [Arachis duranensis]
MEGLKVSNANLTVYLHPSKSRDASEAILRELSSLLFTFSEALDGVVLAYDINSLDNKAAKILSGVIPYFGVPLSVDLLLFSPKPDMLLEGKVVKLSQESIHVVVLGFSSAIITEKDIREEFVYKIKHEQDVYASKSHKRHVIKVGTMIRFSVKSFDEEILHIYGSLMPDHTGSIHIYIFLCFTYLQKLHRIAKKRESEGELTTVKQDAIDGKISPLDSALKIKRSKKQKIQEES